MIMSLESLKRKFNLEFSGIIHIGANWGQELDLYNYLKIKDLLLFEPIPEIYTILVQRIENYKKYFNIKSYNIALGNDNKCVEMFISDNDGQSSSVLSPNVHLTIHPEVHFFQQKIIVPMMKLDDICFNREKFNTIVIDVQGFELEVFKGSIETLSNIEYIYTEVNKDFVYSENGLVDEIDEFLRKFGFKRVETFWPYQSNVGELPWGDALYIKEHI